jgi:hypothetical protein
LADFLNSSLLKPFGQMNRNLVGSIYGRSSIKIAHCILQSVGTFGQAVSEKIKKNRPIRNKNCLWRPCLLTDWNEISNHNRGLSNLNIDISKIQLAMNWITDKYMYASKCPQPNELKFGRKHLWKALIAHFVPIC